MIELKSKRDVMKLRTCNLLVYEILEELRANVRPGITTWDLEELSEKLLKERNVAGAFKGLYGFPCNLCASVNDEVVHGIPTREKVLKEGDIVSLDFGVFQDGFYGDAAITVGVGQVTPLAGWLIQITEEALYAGIEQIRAGNRVSDISHAIQEHAEKNGFSVVRKFVGHGIGRRPHEPPQVPNFGEPGVGAKLEPGMVLAIEPMVNAGGPDVEIMPDGWTAVTVDGSLSAHFEHSVAVTEDGPFILSKP